MKNKSGMSLSIVFLVLATVILMGSSLVIFNIRKNQMSVENSFVNIEGVYVESELTEFYIENIINEVANSNYVVNKQDFINRFRNELRKYNQNGNYIIGGLDNIEIQLIEKNIELKNNKIFLTLEINTIRNIQNLNVSYSYSKTFEKELLVTMP